MSRDPELKAKWELLVSSLSDRFSDGDPLDLDAIIYLVGLQERFDRSATCKGEVFWTQRASHGARESN